MYLNFISPISPCFSLSLSLFLIMYLSPFLVFPVSRSSLRCLSFSFPLFLFLISPFSVSLSFIIFFVSLFHFTCSSFSFPCIFLSRFPVSFSLVSLYLSLSFPLCLFLFYLPISSFDFTVLLGYIKQLIFDHDKDLFKNALYKIV